MVCACALKHGALAVSNFALSLRLLLARDFEDSAENRHRHDNTRSKQLRDANSIQLSIQLEPL